jgi:hypothetical protein
VRNLGFLRENAFQNVEEAVAAALRGLPKESNIVVMPEGPYTFACVA